MRLGETNFDRKIDCDNDLCADAPIEIPVSNTYSRYDDRWTWADNIGLIELAREVKYSSKLALSCGVFLKWKSETCGFLTPFFKKKNAFS